MAIHDWHFFCQEAGRGYEEAVVCLATIEVVERQNTQGVIAPMRNVGAGYAAALLLDGALFRLNMFVVSAFDALSKPDDRNLRAAIHFLTDRPGDIRATGKQREFLDAAIAGFDKLASDPRLISLKHLRNKSLAHRGILDPAIPVPRYADLFGFTNELSEVWENLAFGSGKISIPLADHVDAYRKHADAFWSKWERDPH